MFPNNRELRLFKTKNGRVPFHDWLTKLKDRQGRALVRIRIDRLCIGHRGNYRSLGNRLFELKINYDPGYRIYYGDDDGKLILILCGGDKGTQKRDIERAKKYWNDYRGKR